MKQLVKSYLKSEVYLRCEAVHDYVKRPTNHQIFEVRSSPSCHQVRRCHYMYKHVHAVTYVTITVHYEKNIFQTAREIH